MRNLYKEIKRNKFIVIPILIIMGIAVILFIFIRFNFDRKIIVYDYRLTYSDQYDIKLNSDVYIIDKIIDNISAMEGDGNAQIRLGGFIIIEEYKGDLIEAYRMQGTNVTKCIYKSSYDNLLSISYYHLDQKYIKELKDLCDELRK